ASVLQKRIRRGTKRPQIAARFRFCGAIREQQSFVRDAAQPKLFLLRSGSDRDRIAAEKCSQYGSRDPQVDARHFLTNAVDIERASAHAAEFFRNKKELNSQFVGATHIVDDFDRALVTLIEL